MRRPAATEDRSATGPRPAAGPRSAPEPRRRGPRPEDIGFGRRFVAATSFGSVLNPVNSSIIAVALVSIGHAFGVGASATTWLVSALYLATAIGQPTMGRLADLVGPRRVYLAGTAAVAAGGLLGYLGWSLGSLIVARIVIGFGTSAAYPAAMAMVRGQARRLRVETPGGVLGALAIAGQATMAVGPPLGGLLIAVGGWRLTFLINVPLAAVGIVAVLAWLPADDQRVRVASAWHELDPPGLVLFAAALTGLLLFLMSLASPRWWLLGVTVVLLTGLTARELRAHTPFLDVRMLARNRALTTTYVRFGVTMLITYGFIYGWTPWLEQSAGLSAADAGLVMVPSFVVAAVVSALAARRSRVWPLLVAGAAALVAGSAGLLLLTGRSPLWLLLVISVVFGAQNGLNVVTNQTAMYAQAPADSTGTAAGMLRTFMYLGAIASASLISLSFGRAATDAGLHRLAVILTIAAAGLLAATLVDGGPGPRRDRRRDGS
ncbi:MAG: MFS transporter [Streptosporangiaceae bacterium]|nr:MFS transporter [Streptosporangiaceae bacterium]